MATPVLAADSSQSLVSVVTPAYNAERFIARTIRSVIEQSWKNWEMLIADDCSRDSTYSIAEEWAARDSRVRVFRMPCNRGQGPARNAAIDQARGRYIAFLDSDDLWDSDKLSRQIPFMEANGHAFTYTDYRVIAEDDTPLGSAGAFPATLGYSDALVRAPGCLTVVLDRRQLPSIRFPDYRRNQDGALWLDLLRDRRVVAHGLGSELASYRVVATSVTANKWKAAVAVWRVYREQERLAAPVAAWYFAQYAAGGLRRHLATRARASSSPPDRY